MHITGLRVALMLALLILSSIVLQLQPSSAQAVFTAVDIGLPEGYEEVVAVDVNNSGLVVVNGRKEERWHTFVYREGVFIELGDPKAENYATAINEDGLVAGWSIGGEVAINPGLKRAVLLGEEISVPALSTGYESSAGGIGSQGFVVGQAIFAAGGPVQATVWTPETVNALDGLIPGESSAAVDMNSDRQIGGWATTAPGGPVHAVIWTETVPLDLGVLGGEYSQVSGITEGGRTVGSSTTAAGQDSLDADGVTAFLWADGAMTALPPLVDQVWSQANDLNAFGLVAGAARIAGAEPGATVAVVWGVRTAMDVNDVVEAIDGRTFTAAIAVNDRGQVLCQTVDTDGQVRIALLSTVGT